MPDLGGLLSSLMGGGESGGMGDVILSLLPQFMGEGINEMELPGLAQMMLGMLDAQFANAPREYVYAILSMSRQMLDALMLKYAPEEKREAGAVISEDQGY